MPPLCTGIADNVQNGVAFKLTTRLGADSLLKLYRKFSQSHPTILKLEFHAKKSAK